MDDTLAEQGFLSQEMANVVYHVRAKYKPWLDMIQEINKFAVHAQYSTSIHRDNIQEKLVALLFVRTLSNVQAGVLLLERGMEVQASVILRAATESDTRLHKGHCLKSRFSRCICLSRISLFAFAKYR